MRYNYEGFDADLIELLKSASEGDATNLQDADTGEAK